MESQIDLWVHLLAFAVYTLATVALIAAGVPAITRERDPIRRARRAAAVLRIYDPLSLAALGVAIMTGAFSLTGYKAALGPAFFERMGRPLVWKLFFTFMLVNVAAYVAFGIGHRVVRAVEGGEPPDAARLTAVLRRLIISCVLALALVAAIVWQATQMSSAVLAPIAAAAPRGGVADVQLR